MKWSKNGKASKFSISITHLHQVRQALEQLAEGQEAVFTRVERGSVGSQVVLTQLLHPEPPADLLLLLGHEQRQQLGSEQAQRLPVDELDLPTRRAIHHLQVDITGLGLITIKVKRQNV